jgi:uncharacterized membrane protein YqjE
MAGENRSFVDIVQDVVSNVQDIVSSEVRLARAEITAEAKKAANASRVLAAGVLLAFYAVGLLLLASVYALTLVTPAWAAALVVFGAVTAIAGALILAGRQRLKQVHAKPEAAIESVKENVQWLKTQTR